MLPIESRAEREARRTAKETDAQTNTISAFDEFDQSTTSLATSPPTERTYLSTLTGNDIGTSVDFSSESSTSTLSPNQNVRLHLPPRFKEWIKGSMNAGSPYSDSASDDLHLNTVVRVNEQVKGEGQVKTDHITFHSSTNQVIASNCNKVDMSGDSLIDMPIHSVSTDNVSPHVCDVLSNLNNSGGDDGERFNFQSPSCDSSDEGDDSSTETPDFCPTAPSMQNNLIQYVEPSVGWRGDNSTNKSPQIVHRLVERHTCGGMSSSPPQHTQVTPRNPAPQKICDNLSPRQPNRLPPGQALHQTSVPQPQRKIAGPFFVKSINTTEHPHVPQQVNISPKKVLTFAKNLPTKHSPGVFGQSQLSNLHQPPDKHVHGVSLQENVVFDRSPPKQVINTQQPQGQLKFEQDLRSPAFNRREHMPSDSSQLAHQRVNASVDMRTGHMTQTRRSSAEFENLVEKLQIASRKLKEKVSETHGTKQELESTKVKMNHCEGQLVTLKATLERSQKELKDSQHERMNMEQELFSLQQQLDSLRNATSCAACVTKVPASELKYVMDTMSASNVELTSCPRCKEKDAELKKVSQQLEILYKSTRISEAGLNGQQSFMEMENRRLLNERNSAQEKLKTIRQEFDKQKSYLENENKVRQESLKAENEKLSKELKKAQSDVEGLKAITRKQEADSMTFMNASLRDENATLKNENVHILHELQNLREQLEFSLITPLPEATKNSWQEANELLSAELAQAAEEMKQLQEMNKQLNVKHLTAQQEVKKLRDQMQLSSDAFNAEKLTDELHKLQQRLEAALEENRRLEEELSKAYEEGEALRISDTQTSSVTTQVKMDTQSHTLLKEEIELLTSKLKDSTLKKSRSTEAKLESVSCSLLKKENADLASKLKESIRKDCHSRSTEARMESESVSALRKAHDISMRKEFQTQSTETQLESVSCSSLRKENENLTFKIKELVKEHPRQSQHVEAKLESVSAGELRRENEDLALKLKDLHKKGSQRVQFTEAKLDTDSYILLKQQYQQQQQKLPSNIQESLSTQVVFFCENCSLLRYENERLHADLKTFNAAVNDGASASTLATDSFSALRSENAQLATQLEETKRELTQIQEKFASLVRKDDSTSLVSHTDKSENALVPVISVPLLTSSHSRTPPDDPQSEKADQKISDLTEKLIECNKLRQTASGELKRLMAEWEKERTITAEQQQKTIDEKNAELERLHNELRRLEGSSTVGDCQALTEENNMLRRQINHLQDDLDLLKQQSAASSEAEEVSRLKAHISHLEAELESLHEKYMAAEAAKEKEGRKDLELNRLQHELSLARKDIELYQKGQSPCGSTAYVVRMRDQAIVGLHKKIAEMERFSQQCRDSGFSPRSKTSTPRREISPKRDDATEMLVIMTDETARMKESIDKLESDNVKLIELIKQRDAKIFEMEDEIEWLIKGSTQQDMITVYTQKLKEGEEEMGKLHQSMEALTKKHSNLLIADSSEGLDKQTNYTRQLTQLILNSLGADRPLETDMRKLLNELDNLEKKNFELTKALREYERVKAEQLPKLRNDLEELRKARNDLRGEFDDCNQKLKLAQRDIDALRKEKMDLLKNHEVAISSKRDEMAAIASRLEVNESNLQGMMRQKDAENLRLRDELNHLTAVVSERDGALTHWKIKCEDINRQMADMEERHSLVVKAKNKEIKTLTSQVGELAEQMDKASSVNDPELFRLQSQLKEAQRQHSDILEQNETTLKLKEEEMRRLYSEIGDMSAHLHTINKDKETEIQRLRKEVSLLKEEKNNMLVDSQATMEEKQAEIRKLMVNAERMEVEAATQRAKKEQEMTLLQAEFDQKMEKLSADRAHMVAVKDNELHNLKQEVERLLNDARDGGSSIAEMRRQIFHLEQDKSELLLLKDQWQSDMDKLYTEYEICRNDRADFEEMVDRLSKEMEERVEGLRQEHKEILKVKDAQIRELYIKVEKIARERGDMSAHLHRVLQEKERKIAELFEKLEEYDRCLDSAERSFKVKLQKKSEEIRWLREEIHKMGEEGLRLLQLREREIVEMRAHLTNMLKVMNQKSRARVSSHVMITRPAKVTVSEPHLRTARPPRPPRAGRTGMASSHVMRTPTASKTKRR